MSTGSISSAMPFGKATAVMAGEGKGSLRPKETATPLAEKLGLTLHMPCIKTHADCFVEKARNYLTDNGTLVVVCAHESIPPLIKALNIPSQPSEFDAWPDKCESVTWSEPSCCSDEHSSICYDAIWQINFTRSGDSGSWKPQSITSLAEGFGGDSSSPCGQDLAARNEQVVV